jgi:hypothetical protein
MRNLLGHAGALTVFILVLHSTLVGQSAKPPDFKQYSADVYAGKPAPLNLRSHRLARTYRTSIREQLQEQGINFAGHYTIAVMGCGTGCSITAIVDARNGSAYFPRELDGWSVEPGVYDFADDEDVRTFRTDSRLLKIIGAPRLGADERWGRGGIYYYEWKKNRLQQVQFVPTKRAETGSCLISIASACSAKPSARSAVITNVWDKTAEEKTEGPRRGTQRGTEE